MNKSFILDSPIFLFFKKHFCPDCGQILAVKKEKKIVNSKTHEAKNFDFSAGDTYLSGDVEFFFHTLHCDYCNMSYSIKEIKDNEKMRRKNS